MPDFALSAVRHRYRIYGLVVESELVLTSVEPCSDATAVPEIEVVLGSEDLFGQRVAGLREDSEDWIRYTVLAGGDLYIRINQVFEAIVEADGRRVICARLGPPDDRTFEANLVNFALSASLTLKGEECLHATVIELDGSAIGLLGASGAGKSTLAAYLIAQGATLITDDMLRVAFSRDGVRAHPGPYRVKLFAEPASRLLPAAAADGAFNRLSGKVMFHPDGSPRPSPVPLAALFWLGEGEPPAIRPAISSRRLAGMEQVKVLTGSTMNTRYLVPERLGRQLRFAERLAREVPIHALSYRRDYALLDKVLGEIRRVLRA
jgi:hypothetical protein